jgi:hypothetical protein
MAPCTGSRADGTHRPVKRAAPLMVAALLGVWWTKLFVGSLIAPVEDADVWWVAAAGRRMLANSGAVPRTNGFSFTEPDHPWVMHEWLFGPAYAWGLRSLGPQFFALAAAGAFALTGALVAIVTVGRARHRAVGCVCALVALVLFAHPTARPTWVALIFPAAMALLAFQERLGLVAACGCVLLELVWTNAHGSFPLGVALLAAGAAASTLDRKRRITVALLAAMSTLVNPYGLRLHALVLDYGLGAGENGIGDLGPIVEYAPLWDRRYFAVHSAAAMLALAGLVLLAAWALLRRRHCARAALVLALAPMAILHARHVPMVALVAALVLLPVLDDAVASSPLVAAYAGAPWHPKRTVVGIGAGALAAMAGIALATVASRPESAWIDPALGGASFLRLVDELPDGANVVTPFRSAGLVLWLASPRGVRVFYDSRNDCYSGEMRRIGLTLLEQPPAVIVEELERRGTTAALVPSPPNVELLMRRGYDGALAGAPRWSIAAREGNWAIYRRDGSR